MNNLFNLKRHKYNDNRAIKLQNNKIIIFELLIIKSKEEEITVKMQQITKMSIKTRIGINNTLILLLLKIQQQL